MKRLSNGFGFAPNHSRSRAVKGLGISSKFQQIHNLSASVLADRVSRSWKQHVGTHTCFLYGFEVSIADHAPSDQILNIKTVLASRMIFDLSFYYADPIIDLRQHL